MRIFLTGIDGFAGRHLAARLAGDGHDVVGSSLEPGDILDGSSGSGRATSATPIVSP